MEAGPSQNPRGREAVEAKARSNHGPPGSPESQRRNRVALHRQDGSRGDSMVRARWRRNRRECGCRSAWWVRAEGSIMLQRRIEECMNCLAPYIRLWRGRHDIRRILLEECGFASFQPSRLAGSAPSSSLCRVHRKDALDGWSSASRLPSVWRARCRALITDAVEPPSSVAASAAAEPSTSHSRSTARWRGGNGSSR